MDGLSPRKFPNSYNLRVSSDLTLLKNTALLLMTSELNYCIGRNQYPTYHGDILHKE